MAEAVGSEAFQASEPMALLALERSVGIERFAALDRVIGGLLERMLRGDRIIRPTRPSRGKQGRFELLGLGPGERQLLTDQFSLSGQEAQGAWAIPEEASLRGGLLLVGHHLRERSRYVLTLTLEERFRVGLADPDALFIWAVLEPAAELFARPLILRGAKSGEGTAEERRAAWDELAKAWNEVGLPTDRAFAHMRPGGGWSGLGADERLELRVDLFGELAEHGPGDLAARLRARRLLGLVRRYRDRAKGKPILRRRALTKAYERELSACFSGDWYAFLSYLGEAPHPQEVVQSALPSAEVIGLSEASAERVGEATGVPPGEVERILEAFWGSAGAGSPIGQRVQALADYWQEFDQAHARQTPERPSLWGIAPERSGLRLNPGQAEIADQDRLEQALGPELTARARALWGGCLLAPYPDRVVSETNPFAAMADASGPALRFWDGVALTAWFICFGPTSRTDIPGLSDYHAAQLQALVDVGHPVPTVLFAELSARDPGPPPPLAMTITVSFGDDAEEARRQREERRAKGDAFLALREVIDRHRRAWMDEHLDSYLRGLARAEIERVAREFHRLEAGSGRIPTPKRFAPKAQAAVNHWFGGDLAILYRAMGEPTALTTTSRITMPDDRQSLLEEIFVELGGSTFIRRRLVASREEARQQVQAQQEHWRLMQAAELALEVWQLEEALGRPPTADDCDARMRRRLEEYLGGNAEETLEKIRTAMTRAASRVAPVSGTPTSMGEPPPNQEARRSLLGRIFGRS